MSTAGKDAGDAVTVIEPPRPLRSLHLGELWVYRELLHELTLRDVRVRYKQSLLGAGWAVLRPLLSMAVFTIVFGRLARVPSDGYPYSLFVFAGLLPWTFFSGAVTACGGSLIGSSQLVSKVYFPRLIVPFASVASCVVDLVVSALFLVLLCPLLGIKPGLRLVALPLLVVLLLVVSLGVGTFLAALTVSYRDALHVVPFLLQSWLFLTPVVYPASLVPEKWRFLLWLNPLTGVVEGFRSAFLDRPFDAITLGFSAGIAVIAFLGGIVYFEGVERRFADII